MNSLLLDSSNSLHMVFGEYSTLKGGWKKKATWWEHMVTHCHWNLKHILSDVPRMDEMGGGRYSIAYLQSNLTFNFQTYIQQAKNSPLESTRFVYRGNFSHFITLFKK